MESIKSNMEECLFCKIIKGEVPSHKIYDDDDTYVFLDIGPVSRGHCLIIPKEHAENIHEGSLQAAQAVIKTLHYLAPKMVCALGASGYNIGLNIGKDAGQLVFHTHLHFMPRYAGEPRAFVKTNPSQEELQEIADQIRHELKNEC
ncbi:MAG: HIT family protein [Patescibacteria group bacterium]